MDRYKGRFNRGLREYLSLKNCFCLYWEVSNNLKTLCLDLKLSNSLKIKQCYV